MRSMIFWSVRHREVPKLSRGEVPVEQDDLGPDLFGMDDEVFDFALPEDETGVRPGAVLLDRVQHLKAARSREFLEFIDGALCPLARALIHAHKKGPFSLAVHVPRLQRPRELVLQRFDERQEVPVQKRRGAGFDDLPLLAFGVFRKQVRILDPSGQTVFPDLYLADEIQSEVGEVGEVVLREGLSPQVGMQQAKPDKTGLALAKTR